MCPGWKPTKFSAISGPCLVFGPHAFESVTEILVGWSMGLHYIFLNKALLLYVLGSRVIIRAKKSLRHRGMSRAHGRHLPLGQLWIEGFL